MLPPKQVRITKQIMRKLGAMCCTKSLIISIVTVRYADTKSTASHHTTFSADFEILGTTRNYATQLFYSFPRVAGSQYSVSLRLIGPDVPAILWEFWSYACMIMRLINVHDLGFEEFFEGYVPPYIILSHRWGADEISYKDFLKGRRKQSLGHQKVLSFCELVREQVYVESASLSGHLNSKRIDWVWIDACCIDKRSSAELSEAINSMFEWYKKAFMCIVYLQDFRRRDDESLVYTLSRCEWFSRGCGSIFPGIWSGLTADQGRFKSFLLHPRCTYSTELGVLLG